MELFGAFDAQAASMSVVGDQYTLSLRNRQRDRLMLRNNPESGLLEMRYEPNALHKQAFGQCSSSKCGHSECGNSGCGHGHHQHDHGAVGIEEAVAATPQIDSELAEKFDDWVALGNGSDLNYGFEPGEYQAINYTPGIDPLTGRGTKAADPIPFGEKYNESLQEFQYWAQTGPDLLSGDKANPTDAEIAAMLTRMLITFEEIDEIYERNMATKMLVAELMIRRENDGGPDKGFIMGTWRNGNEALVGHGNFYGWGGGGAAAGNSFNISSWPVGAAHEIGHILSMGHSDGSDLMGPGGGPAHFWGYLTPGPYNLPVTAHQLWREFSGRAQLRTRGLKEHGKIDGENDYDLRTANGTNRLRHPAETPFANDDAIVTALDTPVIFDPLANDDRATPGSPYYNEHLFVEEVSRIIPPDAGTLEIVSQGKEIKFTPSAGFEGTVYFNYTLRGSVGNNGRGWLSRAPVVITVGSPVNDPNTIDLAVGQDQWTIFPASLAQVDYPTMSNMLISGDAMLLRSHPDATGSEQITVSVGGSNQTVTINYITPTITVVDDLVQTDGERVVRFNPLVNDIVTGQLRNEWNISTVVAETLNTSTDKNTDFARSYVLTSATLDTPAMGTLELEETFHIFPDGSTGVHPNGFLRFTPADGASGFAVISYTAQDVDGRVLNGTSRVLVGIADVVRPARPYTRIREDHGLVLESQRIAATGPDFSGTSTLQWTVVDQPAGAVVSFEGDTSEYAVAKFSEPGRYRLRLSATDNGHTKTVDRWVIVEEAPLLANKGEERAPWADVNHLELIGWNQGSWNTSELVTAVSDDRFAGLVDLAPDGTATRSDGNNAEAQTIVTPSEYHAFTQYYGNQNGEFGSQGSLAWWELDLGAEKPVQWVDVNLALSALEDSDYRRYGLVAKLLDAGRNEVASQKLMPKNEHHFAHRIPLSLAAEQSIRYVRIEKTEALSTLALWEVRVMGLRDSDTDLTLWGTVSQSTTPNSDFDAYKAINKLRGGINGSRTDTTSEGNWWELTLDEELPLSRVRMHLETAMSGGTVTAYNASDVQTWQVTLDGNAVQVLNAIPANTLAKRIRVELPSGLTNASGDKAVRINEFWAWGEKDLSPVTQWSQVSGPATASFADASAVQTGVTLPAAGTYVLRLTTDDLWNKTVRDFTVQYDGTSTGPVGYGLADVDLDVAGGNHAVGLFAAFDDAETADASMSFEVVSVSNASIFSSDPTGVIADPANFSLAMLAGASGSSTVTIRATDGNSNSTDLVFDVAAANRAPIVPDVLEVLVPELSAINTVLVDLANHVTDPDGDSLSYAVHDDLINRRYSGRLSLAADGKLSLIGGLPVVSTQYSAGCMIIEVNDGVNHIQKFSVQLTMVDENRAPDLVSATVPVEDTAVPNHPVYQVGLGTGNDPGEAYTWQIVGGNDSGDWGIDASTGQLIPLVVLDAGRTASYTLQVQATDNGVPAKSSTVDVTLNVGLNGLIAVDYWGEIGGNSVADLTANAAYPDAPESRSLVALNGLHFTRAGDSFGRRVRGYLTVPQSGDYILHVASDDSSEVYLSTDENPANAVNVVSLNGWTSDLNFAATASSAITLEVGQRYYLEMLHKEGGGGDHLSLGWTGPGGLDKTLIANEYFEPLEDADGDGLSDWWEGLYLGNLDSDGSGDPDADGLSNADELLARTHPLVSERALAWEALASTSGSPVLLDTSTLPGNATRSVDLSAITGDATYEFFVNAEELGQSSLNLLNGNGRALKFEQWNNRGVIGATRFGYSDWTFAAEPGQSTASPYGALHHVVFVTDSATPQTRLYIDGVLVGTLGVHMDMATSSATLGDGGLRDDSDPGVFAFAAYDSALDALAIADRYNAWMGNQTPIVVDGTASISEGVSIGSTVTTVQAVDPDAGDTLSYSITAGNVGNAFAIDGASGVISTSAILDYATTSQYVLTVEVSDGSASSSASITVDVLQNTNSIAGEGTGIMGVHDGVELSALGTSYFQAGTLADLTDGNTSTDVDTWNGSTGSSHSYVGLTWPAVRSDYVSSIELTISTYLDGGWFGVNNAGPGAGGLLQDPAHVSAASKPVLQVTTDGGVTWTTVAATDDYLAQMTGHSIGGGANPNPTQKKVTFTLDTPVTGIDGLRLIGTEGGTASGGFIGIAEVEVWAQTVVPANAPPAMADTSGSVAENGPQGEVVVNMLANDSDGDSLSYQIIAGNGAGEFAIDSVTGVITTTGALDYETASQYVLTVEVSDGEDTDTATATIDVTNVNEAPVANDTSGSIAENTAAGAGIATVSANDVDAGDSLAYAITAGNTGGAFTIDTSGNITTATVLNYEAVSSYNLTVTVTDAGGLTDTASVSVNVSNVNEAPVANDAAGSVAEDVSSGTVVLTLAANDPDAGDSLGYAITAGNTGGAFAIDASGNISTAAALDYESTAQYVLTVTVTDGGALSNTATVTLDVTNVNEDPNITDDSVTVAETLGLGSVLATFVGSDPDAGDSLDYAITAGNEGNLFAIASNGEVTLVSALDYEVATQHVLTVEVSDAGGLTDTATLTVDVTDVASLASGDVIAVDLSSAGGSAANYNVINTSAGVVAAGSVLAYNDGQVREDVSLTLSAVNGFNDDPAAANWSGTAADSYYVTDADDITFSPSPISLTLSGLDDSLHYNVRVYNMLDGQPAVVETTTVTDGAGTQQNVETRGNIWAAATLEDAGQVFSGLSTDGSGNLVVTVASAGGWSVLNAVVVEAVSPNQAPVASDTTFGVDEDAAIGSVVGTVGATDPDAGDTLSYAITAGNGGGEFTINSTTGEITTAAALDYETLNQYVLTVTVTDNGTLTDTASVTIDVTDVLEISAPVVSTGSASAITQNSADIAYTVSDDGGEAPTVTVYYGTSDGGQVPANWDSSLGQGAKASGAHVASLPSLTEGTTYYFTVHASNSAGESWGSTGSFTTEADTSPKLVRTTVSAVSSTSWTNVDLGQSYNSAVIVATPVYPNTTTPPVVTRIQNVSGSSFDLKIDRADGQTGEVTIDVSVIAVEEGVYTQASDGVTMEAVKYTSTVTAENNSWVGEARSYQNSYTNPVVVGQVMSANDANWSVFWSMGSSRTAPASASVLNLGKHVGEDPNTTRANETIGYIVIESGNGTINGVAYEAALGADTVRGFGNSSNPYSYSLSGTLGSASAAAASISGMDGGNGAWAVLSGSPALTASSIGLYAAEDQMNDSEQSHTTTQVGYIVFE